MSRKKIFNDPVYGFIGVPYGLIFKLVEHPYFQRLRRIKQVGLTHYVYPGALHTRFHHALGALHLMTQAIEVLRSKGISISAEESEAVSIAILLHDIGHGPFSHALEHTLVDIHHERLSVLFMEELNHQFDGKLQMAIDIFLDKYSKPFLHQLVSGQLDMDRMDYLNRDSYFTGVSEGVIGYDRITKMLSVVDDQLVVEEKGIYSVEKFLIARRLMYWQVYLHKTSLCAEQLLIRTLSIAKEEARKGRKLNIPDSLAFFFYNDLKQEDFENDPTKILGKFALLDDHDIIMALKNLMSDQNPTLAYLAKSIINRRLFKIELTNSPFESDYLDKVRHNLRKKMPKDLNIEALMIKGNESNSAYSILKEEIKILFKNGAVLPMSEASDHGINPKIITKHYLCYPKNIF